MEKFKNLIRLLRVENPARRYLGWKPPGIDLKEMEEIKRRNFEEHLKFIEFYVKWLK